MPNQEKLIQWILATLRKHDWSISEFARQADVSTVAISNVLNHRRNAGVDLCLALAKATHTQPELVLRMAGILPPTPDVPGIQEYQLLAYYRDLDKASQHALITLARALHEQRGEYNTNKIDRERE